MRISLRIMAVAMATLFIWQVPRLEAQTFTWNDPNAGSWNDSTRWSPVGVPNGAGVEAVFNGLATANNPDQTGNHNVTLDNDITVGRIVFNNNRQFGTGTVRNQIMPGTNPVNSLPGTLTFDDAAGPTATIFVPSNPGVNVVNTITAPMVFQDNVVATVDTNNVISFLGGLALRGPISGPGGFTKVGEGLFNFDDDVTSAGQPKTYIGPTTISGGRFRVSAASAPTMSSSVTIDGTAQLEPRDDGVYTLGAGSLILNPSGAGAGASGVIRPGRYPLFTGDPISRGSFVTITNDIVVQANSIIHSQTQAGNVGSITLPGDISGTGMIQFTNPGSDANVGSYFLSGANTYAGGTRLNGGNLTVSGGSATLGTGNVEILQQAGFRSVLNIEPGVSNAIADTATLVLQGGGGAGADANYANLGVGVDEVVTTLDLLGVGTFTAGGAQDGTYGSTASGADFVFDEFFSGLGVVRLGAAPPKDADFDNNGIVDGNDFLLFQRGLGTPNANLADGDADNDDDVDVTDLQIFKNQFGTPGGAVVAVAPVPEPHAALLALLAAPLALRSRRRR